jgi:SAM-dependent methyltransferase
VTGPIACWCGNADLVPFCPGYARCPVCETLVSAEMPAADIAHVVDEDRDFYGREYWFSYQEKHLGHPTIVDRARSDLPERCLYWLQALLKYRRPPARVLELGSSHGGFVAMLRWAGFDATGLEVSPWVVDFARKTFDVRVLTGPIEDQSIEPASLDVIALMDVLEHLRDPAATMRQCLRLLKPDGILLIQTPCYREGSTYAETAARSEQPLEILQPGEHLYLFSRRSIGELFSRLGARHITFEPALFAQYDMFLVVSRVAFTGRAAADARSALTATPAARMMQALLDQGTAVETLEDRLRQEVDVLHGQVAAVDADRAARLSVIEDQGRRLGEAEAERNILLAEVQALREHREIIEADRAARHGVIEAQGRQLSEKEQQLSELQAEVAAQEQQIRIVMEQLRALQEVVRLVHQTFSYRLFRRFGYWGWMDRAMGQSVLAAVRARPNQGGLSNARISSFAEYRASIDGFNSSRPSTALLDRIRAFNHDTLNELNKMRQLRETLVLDVGASPHGYALERALEHGARLYVGVGLDIARPQVVVDAGGSLGLLLKGDAASLPVSSDTFDLVLSINTFGHVLDVDAVLSEIARVLRVGGQALLTFEPIWSSPYGHCLHHFGECAKVVSPWSHLTHTPEQFRAAMADRWPEDASVSLGQAVEWVYFGRELNRLTVQDYRERFAHSDLEVEWLVDLKEPSPDESAAKQVAAATGLSVEDLTTKGLSVLLKKSAPR